MDFLQEAFEKISEKLIALKKGEILFQYRLRDWGISRQRYWGCPIPMEYKDGKTYRAKDLPVVLPVNKDGTYKPLHQMKTFDINLMAMKEKQTPLIHSWNHHGTLLDIHQHKTKRNI